MSSRIVVDEIHGKTANASALTIDSSGRVGRTKVPAWFFVTGDGQAANVALAADPVIWGQKIHDDDGAGGDDGDDDDCEDGRRFVNLVSDIYNIYWRFHPSLPTSGKWCG